MLNVSLYEWNELCDIINLELDQPKKKVLEKEDNFYYIIMLKPIEHSSERTDGYCEENLKLVYDRITK